MALHMPQYRRKENEMSKVLTSPNKGVDRVKGIGGVLAGLFRKILWDLNVDPQMYGSLLTDLIRDPRSGVPNNRRDRSSAIGNYSKHFSKPWMSWKKFVEALRLLQFEDDVTITVTGTSRITKEKTSHYFNFNLGDYSYLDAIDREESNPDDESEINN